MSWTRWTPTKEQPWNLKRVVHLHRRAGFGATWAEIQQDLNDGPDLAINRALRGIADGKLAEFSPLIDGIGDAAVGSNSPERLKAWWLLRMLVAEYPLREKLALMWHNHFATSNEKVGNLAAMKVQNELFYSLGTGKFETLLNAVARDPAMLVWLDAPSNRKGRPNENLAREIMELFSLGVGNYTETDVREAARALTGWTVDTKGLFSFVTKFHDDGPKTILGQTGNWTGDDLLRILLEQTAAADRIAWRLCSTFMGEDVVSPNGLQALGDVLRANQLHIGHAVETILRSKAFFADENIGTRITDPAEHVVSALRAIEFVEPLPATLKMARWTAELGQDLFYPPNVGGWSGGRNWLSTRYIVARANFAAALADGGLSKTFESPDIGALSQEQTRGRGTRNVVSFLDQLILGGRLKPDSRERIQAALAQKGLKTDERGQYALALLLALPESQQS